MIGKLPSKHFWDSLRSESVLLVSEKPDFESDQRPTRVPVPKCFMWDWDMAFGTPESQLTGILEGESPYYACWVTILPLRGTDQWKERSRFAPCFLSAVFSLTEILLPDYNFHNVIPLVEKWRPTWNSLCTHKETWNYRLTMHNTRGRLELKTFSCMK